MPKKRTPANPSNVAKNLKRKIRTHAATASATAANTQEVQEVPQFQADVDFTAAADETTACVPVLDVEQAQAQGQAQRTFRLLNTFLTLVKRKNALVCFQDF